MSVCAKICQDRPSRLTGYKERTRMHNEVVVVVVSGMQLTIA